MPFIDTHNHIIPYVDDGAEDWDTSLTMLRDAEADGIVEVVATPHVLSDADLQGEKKFISRFNELKKRAKDAGITIKLHLGSELYVQPYFDFKRKMTTLAQNGRYFLVEFPMSMIPGSIEARFFELYPEQYTPIIAHPERNGSIISKPSKVLYFVENGALLQITAGSLLGVFGSQVKAVADELMNRNVVHIVASDAHDLNKRTLKLGRAFEYVSKKWGPDRAEALFYTNPLKLIQGEDIDIGEPLDILEYDFQNQPNSLRAKVRSFFRR